MGRLEFEVFNQAWADRTVGHVGTQGIDGFLGLRITEIEAGRLVCEMPVTEALLTGFGNMHGGCLSALCDHVLGMVMYPVMEDGYWAATTEFKINLLRPVTGGTCVASAEIVSMSRRMSVVRIDVTNQDRLVAVAQGTCTIVAPRTGKRAAT